MSVLGFRPALALGTTVAMALAALAGGCGRPAAVSPQSRAQRAGEHAERAAAGVTAAADPQRASATAPPPVWSEDLAAVAAGSDRFALALHRELAGEKGNLFFSPFSIHAALAMTAVGARGDSLGQLRATLHLPAGDRLAAAGDLARFYGAADRPHELAVAAALWGQKGVAWDPTFVSTLDDRFAAGFREADFAADAEGERATINAWVASQTRGRIGTLLPPGAVNDLTRLVVASAIAFKGNWATQFSPAATADEPFHRADGTDSPVPLMRRKGRERHFQGDGFQVLTLPYVGDDLEMVVVLPRERDGLAALEAVLDTDALAEWLGDAEPVEVEIRLPRFRLDHGFDAVAALERLGVVDLFLPGRADLSGMTEAEPLSVAKVLHKAFVEVNEEGTEAAAATAVISNAPGPPPPKPVDFRANRPFLFLIRDAAHGTILFVGRYAGP